MGRFTIVFVYTLSSNKSSAPLPDAMLQLAYPTVQCCANRHLLRDDCGCPKPSRLHKRSFSKALAELYALD